MKLADRPIVFNVLPSVFLLALAVGTASCTSWKDRDGSVPHQESDSDRIETAIAVACAPGGSRRVTLARNVKREDGRWMIDRAILLPSDFTLELDGAWIELAPGTRDNIIRNAGAVATGVVRPNRNIRILGRNGAVLCGGRGNYFSPCRSGDSNGWRAMGILFAAVTDYEIAGFLMKETQCWGISQENGCARGHVHDIEFDSTNVNRNQDGIDVCKGCHDILIENVYGVTGDDTVALTGLRRPADRSRSAQVFKYPCQIGGWWPTDDDDIHDITVRNVRARSAGGDGVVRLLVQDGVKIAGMTTADRKGFVSAEQALLKNQYSDLIVGNTTIAAVFTNARLSVADLQKVAHIASTGMARCIRPVFTMADGDTVYAISLSGGDVQSDVNTIGVLASLVMEKAIADAILSSKIPDEEYLANI